LLVTQFVKPDTLNTSNTHQICMKSALYETHTNLTGIILISFFKHTCQNGQKFIRGSHTLLTHTHCFTEHQSIVGLE